MVIFAGYMLVALAMDAVVGWSPALFRRIGHPVTWIGALIARLDRRANRGGPARRRGAGLLTVAAVLAAAVLPATLLQAMLPDGAGGAILGGLLAWPLVAARSLHEHVAAVAAPLTRGDLPSARAAVAMIVGRDVSAADDAAVARAATESLAENASDGIVAPLVWGALLGLPGIAGYKAVNTMDSMIGHRTERHLHFGCAAARLDDLVNLLPARLTALLIAAASGRPRAVLGAARRDARHHRSPNAGWPEAAMAAALGVRLSGPRRYGDWFSDEPWLNAGARDPGAADLARALGLYRRAVGLGALILVGLAIL